MSCDEAVVKKLGKDVRADYYYGVARLFLLVVVVFCR